MLVSAFESIIFSLSLFFITVTTKMKKVKLKTEITNGKSVLPRMILCLFLFKDFSFLVL